MPHLVVLPAIFLLGRVGLAPSRYITITNSAPDMVADLAQQARLCAVRSATEDHCYMVMTGGSTATSRRPTVSKPFLICAVFGPPAVTFAGFHLVVNCHGIDFRRLQERSPYERPGDF